MFVGAYDCAVESARKHIFLNLAIPLIGNELLKPLGKTSQVGWREFGNNRFEFFNAHGNKIGLCLKKSRIGINRECVNYAPVAYLVSTAGKDEAAV